MKADKIEELLEIPEGIEIIIDDFVTVKGKEGEVKKRLANKKVKMHVKDNKISISAKNPSKREKKVIGTFKAHIKNMMMGMAKNHKYTLKICSGHFPMNASVSNNQFIVKNFIGEKKPRTFNIKQGVNIKVDGNFVIVESADKELAGQTAASIEQLCRIKKKDLRIFEDGIWICQKGEKEI